MPLPQSKKNVGLGHAIINRVSKDAKSKPRSEFHTTDVSSSSKHGLASVTQQGDLEEFLNTAQLAEQDFTAERKNVTVVQAPGLTAGGQKGHNPFLLNGQEEKEVLGKQRANKQRLRVPRRPAWDQKTTPADLARAEKESFLEWRRNLAHLTDAQQFLLTPFERNIEVWRQLWRVLERSHLVVQIVDARNPLTFRCEDLEKYVAALGVVSKSGLQYVEEDAVENVAEPDGEKNKATGRGPRRNLLLINKADLLDEGQRKTWAAYFDKHGIRYAFFSAANAAAIQEAKAAAEEAAARAAEQSGSGSEDDEGVDEVANATEAVNLGARAAKPLVGAEPAALMQDTTAAGQHDQVAEAVVSDETHPVEEHDDAVDAVKHTAAPLPGEAATGKDPTRVLNVLELEELFMASAPSLDEFTNEHGTPSQLVVGLVGYPNVGKSSTINALLGSKKVSVSATPGKTKHFQTLPFSERVTLCDCPGLVFPQFATSTGELVVDGVLPIDQMREYTAPAELVARRIPRDILEGYYGIRIQTVDVDEGGTGQPTGLEVLTSYAIARGFVRQGQGNPDESRAARYVLKDYVNAKILYSSPPPGVDADEFNAGQRQRAKLALKGRRYDPALGYTEDEGGANGYGNSRGPVRGAKTRALDAAFFNAGNQGGAMMKGKKGLPGRGVVQGRVAPDGTPLTAAQSQAQQAQQAQLAAAAAGGGKKKHYKRKEGKVRYAGVTND
ncbi:unnamed protein product [Jaminaea pallidilutea]